MAVKAMTGLETNAEHADYVSIGAGSTIDSTTKRTGSYSLRSLSDATEALGIRLQTLGAGISTMTCRFYLRIATKPTTATNELFGTTWYILSGIEGSTLAPTLILESDGAGNVNLGVIKSLGGIGSLVSGGTALAVDTWYRVEWQVDGSAAKIRVRVDGASEIDTSDGNLPTFGWISVGGWETGTSTNTAGDCYFDDILARDDLTWPGAGQYKLFPATRDSNVGYTGWTHSTTGDAVDVGDTIPVADSADYINTTTADQKGTVRPDDASTLGINGVINGITVLAKTGAVSPTGGYKTLMNIDASDSVSVQQNYTTETWLSVAIPILLTGPYNAASWDTLEGGCQKGTGSNESRVSTVWFGVDWQPSAGGPTATWQHDFIAGSHAIQPDATDGKDSYLNSANNTTNYGTNTLLSLGIAAGKGGAITHALLDFDLSAIGSGDTMRQARLCLNLSGTTSNAITIRTAKVLRVWVEAQATWLLWKTGDSWTTAGCDSDGNDYDSGVQHTTVMSPSTPIGEIEYVEMVDIADDAKATTLRAILRDHTEALGGVVRNYSSSDAASAINRPILVMQVDVSAVSRRIFIT